jgi:hypothetical protein
MTRIVTTRYRYKRPPGKREKTAIAQAAPYSSIAVIGLLMNAVLCCPSVAQTSNSATDHELYAMYCVGALDADIEALQSPQRRSLEEIETGIRNSNPLLPLSQDQIRSGAQAIQDSQEHTLKNLEAQKTKYQNERARFAAYIVATGALTDPHRAEAAQGLAVSKARGEQDSRQCWATLSHCLASPQWLGDDKAGAERYLATCAAAEPCVRQRRCSQPDQLPF